MKNFWKLAVLIAFGFLSLLCFASIVNVPTSNYLVVEEVGTFCQNDDRKRSCLVIDFFDVLTKKGLGYETVSIEKSGWYIISPFTQKTLIKEVDLKNVKIGNIRFVNEG
jgi:hypothetical protein